MGYESWMVRLAYSTFIKSCASLQFYSFSAVCHLIWLELTYKLSSKLYNAVPSTYGTSDSPGFITSTVY
jgi:hypothetical protein